MWSFHMHMPIIVCYLGVFANCNEPLLIKLALCDCNRNHACHLVSH